LHGRMSFRFFINSPLKSYRIDTLK
jgi:hypothetical protein